MKARCTHHKGDNYEEDRARKDAVLMAEDSREIGITCMKVGQAKVSIEHKLI